MVKSYTKQLLEALAFLKKHQIIHCDLKPENIIFKDSSLKDLVIIDFGSSCFSDQDIYNYIQTRWYRSPEVLVEYDHNYDYKIDIWSLGCIVYELYIGTTLFQGRNELEQMVIIYDTIKKPEYKFISKCGKYKYFDNKGILKKIIYSGNDYRDRIKPLNNPSLEDFLSYFLIWEPYKRIEPKSALTHYWLSDAITT